MKENTIELYRKTAAQMRQEGKSVSKAALSKELKRSPASISKTIRRQSWRKSYVGIVDERKSIAMQYRSAALELQQEKVPITTSTLAQKLGRTVRAVQFYLLRNECVFDGLDIKLERQQRYLDAPERYRKAVERMKAAGHPMTRKSLALELGVRYTAVALYLEKHPALAKELGIIYSSEIKR